MDLSLPLQAAAPDTLSQTAQQVVPLQPLLAVLTVALGLSFTVERVLEFINRLPAAGSVGGRHGFVHQ